MHIWKANHAQVLNKFVLCSHLWVFLQIRIAAQHFILFFEVFIDVFRRVQPKNNEQRAERFAL